MRLMKHLICWFFLSCSAGLLAADRSPVSDFSLLDHTGKFHQLSYYGDQRAIVLYSHRADFLKKDTELKAIKALHEEFSDDRVVIFLINSNPRQTRESLLSHSEELAMKLPILVDDSQLVAEDLKFERAGEVLLLDAKKRTPIHRGDLSSVKAALESLISGKLPQEMSVTGNGPLIDYEQLMSERGAVSYVTDVVPILKGNCVKCHQEGAIGPWSMSSHAMVRGFSPMIREVVMTQRMPPGQIDGHIGLPMANVSGLSIQEKRKLVSWIDEGARKDGGLDPLEGVGSEGSKFILGEPDLIVEVPAQSIPATGIIDYRYVPVSLGLDEDVWISGMEFLPGDRSVLHHVIAYLTSPADKTAKASSAGTGENIAGFAPGRQPDYFGEDSGRLIPRGSNLLLQMHYTTSGRETVDSTRVGIYLHKSPPAYVMSGGVVGQRRFMVPPGVKEHKLEAVEEIERDALLYQLTPHMHFRGKYFSYTAEYPDGKSEVILSVPKYDFNWQYSYRLDEPLFLPAGTKLIARGAMDNSDRNPGNPDPSKPVFFGLQTMHEMFFGFITLRYIGDTPAGQASEEVTVATSVGLE